MATALPLANAFTRSDSGTGKVWIQQGRVIEIDDVGNVTLEINNRQSKSGRTNLTDGFSVEFVWKSVTYDRMQEGEEELKC